MSTYPVPVKKWHGLPVEPTTRVGRWAVILAVSRERRWLASWPALTFAPSDGVWLPWG